MILVSTRPDLTMDVHVFQLRFDVLHIIIFIGSRSLASCWCRKEKRRWFLTDLEKSVSQSVDSSFREIAAFSEGKSLRSHLLFKERRYLRICTIQMRVMAIRQWCEPGQIFCPRTNLGIIRQRPVSGMRYEPCILYELAEYQFSMFHSDELL